MAALYPRRAWSLDTTPLVRGFSSRPTRKAATASEKWPMSTQMSARCFAQVSYSPRLFMFDLAPLCHQVESMRQSSTWPRSLPCSRRPRRRPKATSGGGVRASVDQVDRLVRADIDIGHIRRLTVGVFPAQIHVTILALRYFSPRPLAGFQRA
jgi:hypothetical protein